jgi:hypothetical protein
LAVLLIAGAGIAVSAQTVRAKMQQPSNQYTSIQGMVQQSITPAPRPVPRPVKKVPKPDPESHGHTADEISPIERALYDADRLDREWEASRERWATLLDEARQAGQSFEETAAESYEIPTMDVMPLAAMDEVPAETEPVLSTVADPSNVGPLASLSGSSPIKSAARRKRMQVAIIIDDGGYGGAATEAILAMDTRMTLAILPNTPHGTDIARRAGALGFEIMLHMPMESFNQGVNFPGYIAPHMTAEKIETLLDDALRQIPGVVGINNHTGSKFTASSTGMRNLLGFVKTRDLYFVDSKTTAKSVAYKTAREMNVRTAVNNVFLDHEDNHAFMRRSVAAVVARAKQHGQAIIIGHFRPKTVPILRELLQTLNAENIEVVHASKMVRQFNAPAPVNHARLTTAQSTDSP